MDLQIAFNEAGYDFGFRTAVRELAKKSLETCLLPEPFERVSHDYIAAERGLFVIRTRHTGAWAVANERDFDEVIAELLISRLGVLTGVPIAPTFLLKPLSKHAETLPKLYVASLIPYEKIHYIRGDFNLTRMQKHPIFQQNFAKWLPFSLWLGPDTDRDIPNRCFNAHRPEQAAEFDFAHGPLAWFVHNLLCHQLALAGHTTKMSAKKYAAEIEMALRPRNIRQYINDAFKWDDIIPIHRATFEEGKKRVTALPNVYINHMINMVFSLFPMDVEHRSKLDEYLLVRRDALKTVHLLKFAKQKFRDNLPTMRPRIHKDAKIYSFDY